MDKLKMMSMDRTSENIEKIRAIFPNCVTEVLRDGKEEYAIDFDMLRQELSKDIVEGGEERYQMTWPDKKKAIWLANTRITKTLRPCREESVDFDNTENLYIEGDNLEVLKLLQETYLGKVKMIYIDPPYNTGNDSFVYNDIYSMDEEDFKKAGGYYNKEGNRVIDVKENSESNGRFHTDWLNMIYPRLKIARDLLSDDGIIFISIGDKEQANMKKLCDDVFGEDNYITMFIWEKTQHFGRQKLNSYSNSDYVYCYAKALFSDKLKELLVEKINTELGDAPLFNASNNINELTFPAGTVLFNIKDGLYDKSESYDYELLNTVEVKNRHNVNEFSLRFRSRWSNKTVQDEIKKGTTFWVKTANFAIRAIYHEGKSATEAPKQILFTNQNNPMCVRSRFNNRIDTSENATKALSDLMEGEFFSYPKPVSLISYLVSLLYNEKELDFDKNFIALDFFSGSATTAHAVMQLNAEDGGNRKFIMVQLPEACDEKSEAYKAGYKNICEIGKERIRRAGKKIKEENPLATANLDTGFRVLKLDSSNMRDVFYKPEELTQMSMLDTQDNIKPDRSAEDLLFQVMLDMGAPLSAKIEQNTVCGKQVFTVAGNYLMACFEDNLAEDIITAIAKQQPLYAVFRDSSFATDSVAKNVEQIFATYSPDTKLSIL